MRAVPILTIAVASLGFAMWALLNVQIDTF
jgi:hypothetical protein